jgi:hypothetical protein
MGQAPDWRTLTIAERLERAELIVTVGIVRSLAGQPWIIEFTDGRRFLADTWEHTMRLLDEQMAIDATSG